MKWIANNCRIKSLNLYIVSGFIFTRRKTRPILNYHRYTYNYKNNRTTNQYVKWNEVTYTSTLRGGGINRKLLKYTKNGLIINTIRYERQTIEREKYKGRSFSHHHHYNTTKIVPDHNHQFSNHTHTHQTTIALP